MYSTSPRVVLMHAVYSLYRYMFSRTDPAHSRLSDIHSVRLGVTSVGMLYAWAIFASESYPKVLPIGKITGGTSYRADVEKHDLVRIFKALAAAVGITHAIIAFHVCDRSGRVDFHVMFLNRADDGRPLVENIKSFRRKLRDEMRKLIADYNRERLARGQLSIANLSPQGRAFFVEPPQPEPTPELAQPAPSAELPPAPPDPQAPLTPAPAPNAPLDTEPPPSEPAPRQSPVTASPDMDPAIPTSHVVIPPAAEGAGTTIEPESQPAVDSAANAAAPSPVPSGVTPEPAEIAQEPLSPDPSPPSAKSLPTATQIAAPTVSEVLPATTVNKEPTGKVESLPTASATAESGPVPAEIVGLPGPRVRNATDSAPPPAPTMAAPTNSVFTAAEPAAQSPKTLTSEPSIRATADSKTISSPNENVPCIQADPDGENSKSKNEFAASLPSPSPLPLAGATSVASAEMVHAPSGPAAGPSRNQPSSPSDSADSTPSDPTEISPHGDTRTAPIPIEPSPELDVRSADRAGEATAPVTLTPNLTAPTLSDEPPTTATSAPRSSGELDPKAHSTAQLAHDPTPPAAPSGDHSWPKPLKSSPSPDRSKVETSAQPQPQAPNTLAPANLEFQVSNGVQLEPTPTPDHPPLESRPPSTPSVPTPDLGRQTLTEQPLVPHRLDEPSTHAIAERERRRQAAARAEKESKDAAEKAAAAQELAWSNFNWLEQIRILRASGRIDQDILDQPAGPPWAPWLGVSPSTTATSTSLRELLLAIKTRLTAGPRALTLTDDADKFFRIMDQLCGPIAMNRQQREVCLALRDFHWEAAVAKAINGHAANGENPLKLSAGRDWAPLLHYLAQPNEHPTLETLLRRIRRIDPQNAGAAEFYRWARAIDHHSREREHGQPELGATNGPELEL